MQNQKSDGVLSRCSPDILSLTWPEKEELCKEWQRSGLSKTKFCSQRNINVSTFAGWCKKLWGGISPIEKNLLSPVKVTGMKDNASESIVLEVSFPNTVMARVTATPQQFGFLLRELIDATAIIR